MAEYIEREAAERILEDVGSPAYAKRALILVPAADVVPVVHGRWIEHEIPDEPLYGTDYECSVCGAFLYDNWKYCPICGARMDGDTDG